MLAVLSLLRVAAQTRLATRPYLQLRAFVCDGTLCLLRSFVPQSESACFTNRTLCTLGICFVYRPELKIEQAHLDRLVPNEFIIAANVGSTSCVKSFAFLLGQCTVACDRNSTTNYFKLRSLRTMEIATCCVCETIRTSRSLLRNRLFAQVCTQRTRTRFRLMCARSPA